VRAVGDLVDEAFSPAQRRKVVVNEPKNVRRKRQQIHDRGRIRRGTGEEKPAAGMERCGVARALMAAAEAWAAGRGLRCLTLETGAANQAARSFYAALGYLIEDVRLTKDLRTVPR